MQLDLYSSNEISFLALLVSLAGFCISLISLAIAYANFRRDQGSVTANAKFYSPLGSSAASVQITITNAGRRPVWIKHIVKLTNGPDYEAESLDPSGEAIEIKEGQPYQRVWYKRHLSGGPPGSSMEFVDLQVEDSLQRRYKVKNARKNLDKLRQS